MRCTSTFTRTSPNLPLTRPDHQPFPQDFRDYYERMLIAHADEGDIRNRNVIIANRIGIYLGHNSRALQIEKIGEVMSTNMNGEETPTSLWRKY